MLLLSTEVPWLDLHSGSSFLKGIAWTKKLVFSFLLGVNWFCRYVRKWVHSFGFKDGSSRNVPPPLYIHLIEHPTNRSKFNVINNTQSNAQTFPNNNNKQTNDPLSPANVRVSNDNTIEKGANVSTMTQPLRLRGCSRKLNTKIRSTIKKKKKNPNHFPHIFSRNRIWKRFPFTLQPS